MGNRQVSRKKPGQWLGLDRYMSQQSQVFDVDPCSQLVWVRSICEAISAAAPAYAEINPEALLQVGLVCRTCAVRWCLDRYDFIRTIHVISDGHIHTTHAYIKHIFVLDDKAAGTCLLQHLHTSGRMIQSCHTENTPGLELEKKAYYAAAGIDPNEMRDQMIDQPDILVFLW